MKPLIVLIIIFLVCLTVTWMVRGNPQMELSGRIAMAVMLVFTSIGHFKFRKGMSLMIPSFVPAKEVVVTLTGFLEILFAIGLLIEATRLITAIAIIIFFILILPANIYAGMKNLNYETGEYDGDGLRYLWFRVPLQVFFIFWVYWFALH